MAGNERFDDSIGRWLDEAAPNRLPQRVLEATFERTRRSRQELGWRTILRRLQVPRLTPALGGAITIVAVIAIPLILRFPSNQNGIGSQATRAPSATPATQAPSAAPSPTEPGLSSGCGLYDSGGTYRGNVGAVVVSATVPEGWTGDGDSFALRNAPCLFGGSSHLQVTLVGRVYADACDLIGTDVEVRTPAAAIAALAGQKGHETTGPTDVTLGGYQAARFEFSVPADFDAGSECAEGNGTGSMALWQSPGDQHLGQGLGTGVTTVYVVDVDGVTVGVVASNPGAGSEPAAVAELDAIVQSLRFEP